MDYTIVLDEMLSSQYYMFLATTSLAREPWAAPVCYVRGEKNMLYFISHAGSKHVTHILSNPQVAFSIFDNRQLIGNAFGVQGVGIAKKIPETEVPTEVCGKLFQLVSLSILQKEYSFYRIKIDEIYLPDAERWKIGSHLRTKIEL